MIFNETEYNTSWSTKKLIELGDFSRGKSRHRPRNDKKLFNNGKYPLIQTGDIKSSNLYVKKHSSEYNDFGLKQSKMWDEGTLCITIAANIAESGILAYPMCFPDSIVGFTANKNECSELFMYYVFEYIKNSIKSSASGSIQDNINIDYLSNLEFKIPSLKYQGKIVEILKNIDEKINNNEDIIEEINNLAITTYNFKILQKVKNNANIDNLKIFKISDLVDVVTGKEDANFASPNGKYPFFTCSNEILKCDEFKFNGKAVLLTGNGELNIKYYSGKFNAYQRTYVLIPKEEKYVGLIYHALLNKLNILKKGSNGSIVKFITKDDVSDTKIYVPSNNNEIESFNKYLNTIDQLQKENRYLYEIKNYILPLLMNGQIKIDD